MGPPAKHASVSFCLLTLCSVALAGVHRLSYLQLISPPVAPGLPRRLSVERMNDLVLSAYDSDTGRLAPRHGYTPGDKSGHKFWNVRSARCPVWDSWVETEYQALVREVNTSAPNTEPYYMQVLKTCELDDTTGSIRAITRYALNGEDVLRYQSDQNRWFSVHPAAWRVAERWNRAGETVGIMKLFMPQQCRFWIENSAPFTAQKTAQPTARVALIPGTQARPRRLVCHVTGFYPRDIEVTWERRSQVAQGEQLSSGIRPNGDPTFQIQVSIELGREGAGPTEHVCVVRHSSLGNTPLRVTWDSQAMGQALLPLIVAGCILSLLGLGALGWHLRRSQGDKKGPYSPAQTQPWTLGSAPAMAKAAGGPVSTVYSLPNATE